MKQNPEYLRHLLDTLQESPSPWPSIGYLADSGIKPDEQMVFHLQLLNDGGFVQPMGDDSNFGFLNFGDEVKHTHASLRLTAQGHEFIEALDKQEIWDVVKSQFKGASLKTLFTVSRAMLDGYARETLKKHVGNIKL